VLSKIASFLKKRPARWVLEIIIFIGVYFVVRAWTQRNVIEGPLPPVVAVTLASEKIDLQQTQNAPYLLHIWASWCGICRFEQDSIESISKDYPVISIAMQSGNDNEVRQYMQDNGLSFKVINDEEGELSRMFGVTGVPTTLVIDSKGQIAYSEVGYTSEWGLRFRLWLAGND
jgi:thiol-disulfide isomerase/thioredoxin